LRTKSGEKAMKRKTKEITRLPLLVVFLTLSLNAFANNTWYVNGVSGNDSHSGTTAATAFKTIHHAISASTAGDSIIVAAATYSDNLTIGFDLTIIGANARTTIVDGGKSSTAITISTNTAHVSLAQLTIRNGYGVSHGGGIYNLGTLAITNTTISGNTSDDKVTAGSGLGGGIYNGGTLAILDSTVTANTVTCFRPGAFPYGGGIYNTGQLTITNSTVASNQATDYWPSGAPYGGGIANVGGTVSINNSTISKNTALIHTPYGAAGTYGGGVYNQGGTGMTFQNSVFAYNTSGGNCSGTVSSLGFNLSSDTTCALNGPGEQKNIDPKLGVLQNNGGSTSTMALSAGSSAMNGGNPSGCMDASGQLLTTDQRGMPRPGSGACDIGAFNH
jgi:hypothetical protein